MPMVATCIERYLIGKTLAKFPARVARTFGKVEKLIG